MPNIIKPVIVFVVVAVIALSAYFFWPKDTTKEKTQGANFVAVRMGDLEESVTAQGKLEPKEYVDVGVQVSGQLKKINVEIGDQVKKGDLIAEIDPAVYEAKVAADEAQIKSLKAQIAEQEAQVAFTAKVMERNRRLIKSKAISQEALEDSQTNLKVAQARVSSLEAQLEQANSSLEGDKANLSYTKIYAPMDGTVVSQSAREGQTLNANQTAPIVVQVANLDIMTVRTQVAEADVGRVAMGMDVYFTTLGNQDRKWRGKVQQVLPTPETINDVVLYNALVDVENPDHQLMTGMSTQVFFLVGNAKNVPIIPARALGKRLNDQDTPEGNAYQVKVQKGNDIENRVVLVGLLTRSDAEVKSGLSVDERVLVNDMVEKSTGSRRNMPPMGPRL